MTNQTIGTLSGHHSAMIHVVMTGLGSWSSMSANNIQGSGSGSVSVVAHGSNYVDLKNFILSTSILYYKIIILLSNNLRKSFLDNLRK